MTSSSISSGLRSGLMVSAGSALIVGPVALGLSVAAIVTGVAVGTLAMALGFAGTDSQGRGTLSVSSQEVFDRGLSLGMLGAAIAFGATGERLALAFYGALGFAVLLVALTTRYTVRPA